ncbi:right-handed parallel beta-helix repeat-containing protein [Haloferax larsenii]|uniref:Right handed beta helix region n=1 Tax=Haloferax larsenii TaxID=302484 RepID=A0A1H7GHK0_HALLR|nr:hypothetical protein [Haloferax larsenii]SEK37564.1 Right handed beta helix region [Haloferax larsenii]
MTRPDTSQNPQTTGQTRRTILRTAGALTALGVFGTTTAAAATELVPDANGDATITSPGHYTGSATFRTVTISSDDVTLDGLTFGGGASVAVKNGVAGLSNVTVQNCSFSGYSGRMITFGFAEGVSNAANRASNISIVGNSLGAMTGNAATAIAVFDTDGVSVLENTVDRSSETNSGRRGINLDGDTDVEVKRNTVDLGASGNTGSAFGFPVFIAARWTIQISMSSAESSDLSIVDNTLVGAYDGVAVLSQRDVTGLDVHGNDVETVQGVRLNAASGPTFGPQGPTLTYEDVTVSGNRFDGSRFSGSPITGVRLQNNNEDAADVTYRDVVIAGNRATGVDDVVVVQDDGITLEKVRVRGNRSR